MTATTSSPVSGRGLRVAATVVAAGLLAGAAPACGGGDDASSATTAAPTTAPATSSPTTVAYPPSPSTVEEAIDAMDGLFAPSILRPATVGLDPFAISGDAADWIADVDPERLLVDVRALAEPRSPDDVEGLLAAAAVVEDGFGDAGYAVERIPPADEGDDVPPALAVEVPGTGCDDRTLLVVAPYDGPEGSPGARAASATAALLEAARLLAERPLPMSVTFLAVPFGGDDPDQGEALAAVLDDFDLDPVAVYALEGLAVADPEADGDNLTGLPPAYLLAVGVESSQYLARVNTLATDRALPRLWSFTAVADLAVFPEFDDRLTAGLWDDGVQALLVTDLGTRADERVGTADDDVDIVDTDLLANGVRSLTSGLVGVGTVDSDGDGTPDVCQRDW